ncbi:MAG TPA: MFS transporter [Candidatus Limnocylindrales bacterium]|nr:MFS transporter [Candidatus Limnocylindrales bacterium]
MKPADRLPTVLFAVAAGVAVANLYLAQPLLDLIAGGLHTSLASAGRLVTATQIGYAAGILLFVPLGDVLDRRRLIPVMMLCSAAALVLCAIAPSMGVLLPAIAVLGLTTVSGQILVPLAGDLAGDAERGQVVGIVSSGILAGVLAGRTVSGFVAGVAGWRAIFGLAAAVSAVMAVQLHRAIPKLPPRTRMPYPALLASVVRVVVRERAVRWTIVIAAAGFGAFSMFWTALTFLLSGPPFHYPAPVIGLFGLAGLAGAVAVQRFGRLYDRGWSLPATGALWVLALLAFVLAGFAGGSALAVIAVVVALDVALQGQTILNKSRILAVSPEARSRLNTAYITGTFAGGATGSAVATVLWAAGGWTAIVLAGILLCCFALTVWVLGRRGPLLVPQPAE